MEEKNSLNGKTMEKKSKWRNETFWKLKEKHLKFKEKSWRRGGKRKMKQEEEKNEQNGNWLFWEK